MENNLYLYLLLGIAAFAIFLFALHEVIKSAVSKALRDETGTKKPDPEKISN